MKKITIYECNDGTRFDSEKQALEYDVLLSKCNSINDVIGRKVELEYNQYVQRNAETVKKQWRVFCNIVENVYTVCISVLSALMSKDVSINNRILLMGIRMKRQGRWFHEKDNVQ